MSAGKSSGWSSIRMDPVDLDCTLPAEDMEVYMMNMGPVASALRNSDPPDREEIVAAMRNAFTPYLHDGEAWFAIACWTISAVSLCMPYCAEDRSVAWKPLGMPASARSCFAFAISCFQWASRAAS